MAGARCSPCWPSSRGAAREWRARASSLDVTTAAPLFDASACIHRINSASSLLVWVLDPTNSSELLDRLRPHSGYPDFEVVWCGEGWTELVGACHDELAASFPDYRFYAIKEKWGVLAFQARPRAGEAAAEEVDRLNEITEKYRAASEVVCEWCGRCGSLRTGARVERTLCDACANDLTTMRFPKQTPIV